MADIEPVRIIFIKQLLTPPQTTFYVYPDNDTLQYINNNGNNFKLKLKGEDVQISSYNLQQFLGTYEVYTIPKLKQSGGRYRVSERSYKRKSRTYKLKNRAYKRRSRNYKKRSQKHKY